MTPVSVVARRRIDLSGIRGDSYAAVTPRRCAKPLAGTAIDQRRHGLCPGLARFAGVDYHAVFAILDERRHHVGGWHHDGCAPRPPTIGIAQAASPSQAERRREALHGSNSMLDDWRRRDLQMPKLRRNWRGSRRLPRLSRLRLRPRGWHRRQPPRDLAEVWPAAPCRSSTQAKGTSDDPRLEGDPLSVGVSALDRRHVESSRRLVRSPARLACWRTFAADCARGIV